MTRFEMKARDGLARIGRLETPHGVVETPALLPVIHPGQTMIPATELKRKFGVPIVITNSYIIHSSPELRERARREGVHDLLGFDGPVMTDSGTFQEYVYGGVGVDQKEILDFQLEIGSDLCTMLDLFSGPDAPENRVAEELTENLRRAREASERFREVKTGQGLVLTVQGGVFPHLRKKAAEAVAGLECALQGIGGVVPLMESYRFAELVDLIVSSRMVLNPSRPIHLFGAGHPMTLPLATLLGCDTFDSASYAKYARDGRYMLPGGTRHLRDLSHLPCPCPVCTSTTPTELMGMEEKERERLLAEHNLHLCFSELRAVRQAILEGNLWELVEERCRAHPALLDALRRLGKYSDYLERYASVSRPGAFFYKGPESSLRPEVVRWRCRLFERYSQPECEVTVCFPEGPRPYSRHYAEAVARISERWDARFVVTSFFGPVPLELDHMYPIAQSVVPEELDAESLAGIRKVMERFSHGLKSKFSIVWEGENTLTNLEMLVRPRTGPPPDLDLLAVVATADMQFGAGAAQALLKGRVELIKSPSTGRVRRVMVDGEHVMSLRASDGLFSLRLAGGERLRRYFPPPRLRVSVNAEAAEYAAQGRSVFARFVLDCDPELRPGEEALVVDREDRLVAVGRTVMVRDEMMSFKRGVAVKVRHGLAAMAKPGDVWGEED
ncbi:MAG: tRNA guanosine(15) transglycosylase TgtA [Thermoplasmata archaeon]